MTTDLTVATRRFSQAVRFVLPRTDQDCALCGLIEKGYVRDSQTRLVYCDTQCFPVATREAAPVVKDRERKAS